MSKYKLVPVEPTEEMATAAMNAEIHANRVYGEPAAFSDIWRAMLDAAPEAAGEPCRTINIDDIVIDDIVAWADGVQGALGTEHADRVTEMEAAASRAVMAAIASAPDRCPHGVRRPHECKECADTAPASEALEWAEREFAAARQSPGEPGPEQPAEQQPSDYPDHPGWTGSAACITAMALLERLDTDNDGRVEQIRALIGRIGADVDRLVEALEMARDRLESERRSGEFDPLIRDIDDALAPYRKGGVE